ncbi:uncharacterized protein [Euphorbia lathyris]|uniref:uncharacterized protein n=1 Tax=Euphorbia lathyris TaxID=212925 RepID=UPI003313AF07
MRGNIIGRRIPNPISSSAYKSAFLLSSSPFSTSSGRGGGRGGGSSTGPPKFDFIPRAPGKPESDESKPVSPEPQPNGTGRGGGSSSGPSKFEFVSRAPGKPESDESKPVSPEPQPNGTGRGSGGGFSSFISSLRTSKPGIGRGRGTDEPARSRPHQPQSQTQSVPPQTQFAQSSEQNLPSRGTYEPGRSRPPQPQLQPQSVPPQTQFAQSSEQNLPSRGTYEPGRSRPPQPQLQPHSVPPHTQFEQSLPPRIHVPPSGIGRGKSEAAPTPRLTEENRHVRSRARPKPGGEEAQARERPKFSREEAVRRAVSILSKGDGDGYGGRGEGLAQGRGRGGGRGRGRGRGRGTSDDHEESYEGLFLGDDADGEKLAEAIGVENMQKLMEGFEELSDRVLPCPEQDAFVDAMHTNYMIEFEPEYLMGEFDQNPDIDEKPPMPIRDMLEKVKPFIMAYEGIQNQEEWEAVVEETMKRVPLWKEIVDYYSGPDRVTAKKQQEELERVAKTIPPNVPASVKQFTDRAVLSLQSNPGWGFDRKCQFMDKLVREVNQCYN